MYCYLCNVKRKALLNIYKRFIMDKQKSIAVLQAYATGLDAQSLQHRVESKIFAELDLIEKIGLDNWFVKQM